MNATDDLDRRIADFYSAEAVVRAPDWLLDSALATIDTTQQRRAPLGVPWRFPKMNIYAKVAAAAVAVIVVGVLGLAVLRPSQGPDIGKPSPSPSLPAPSAASITAEAFQHPFAYRAPEGINPNSDTETVVAFVPSGRFLGLPAGVAVVAIGGGRVDPCAETSRTLPLPGSPQAVIDYLKTVPTLQVTDEAATSVDGIAGFQAVIRAGSATTDCPDVRLWAEGGAFTQNVRRGDAARVTAFAVGGDHIVILSYGGDADPAWDAVADELIDSFQFQNP